MSDQTQLLRGPLDLLILTAVSLSLAQNLVRTYSDSAGSSSESRSNFKNWISRRDGTKGLWRSANNLKSFVGPSI